MKPFLINFQVKVSLSNARSSIPIYNISTQLSDSAARPDITHKYDYYVGAWMGNDNPHMEFKMLEEDAHGTGTAKLSLPVLETDSDMFKIGVFVRAPDTCMMRHIVTGFQDVSWMGEALSVDSVSKKGMVIKDNYSPNQALLQFSNNGTDLKALQALKLRPSILHANDAINKEVQNMTMGVHSLIESVSNVSNYNGGPNYVMSSCFTQAMGCAINYPLLNMTYSSKRHLTPLSALCYMSLATLHYTGMSAAEALSLNDHDFVHKFIVPMCTSFTVCPYTAQYSGDKTLDLKGNLDQATEDFAMVLCDHYYTDVKDSYSGSPGLAEMSNMQLVDHINALGANLDAGKKNSNGHFLIADDCETLSGMIKSIEGGIHLESHILADGDPVKLGRRMWDCTRGMNNLAAVPIGDFEATAKLLSRYGQLRENCYKGVMPCAQIGLSVVSAKGASFSTFNSDLNGHACTVAQTLDAHGVASYSIGEGTTCVQTKSLPTTCAQKVSLVVSEGTVMFDTVKALSIISQNMGQLLATKGLSRGLQTIPYNFEGKDPYSVCPFYMAGFYIGFEMGGTIPGVIPLDTMHKDMSMAALAEVLGGSPHPMFGAPVADLSMDCVKALPIDLGRAMGEDKAIEFLSSVDARNRDVHPPRVSELTLNRLMSRWGDLEALPKENSNSGNWVLSCSEAFQCADTLRAVGEYKRRLSREFNALQEKDPKSDGMKMSVNLHMHSVVCHLAIPLPVREKWDLSCARNMRLALQALPAPTKVQVGKQFDLF